MTEHPLIIVMYVANRGSRMHEDRHPIGDRGTTREQLTLLYRLLADHRRRTLLQCLRNTEDPVSVSALVVALAHRDGQASSDATVETEIALHHIHLPTLADTGIIEYDQSTQQATYTASPQVDSLLDQILVTVSTGKQEPSLQE